MDTINTPNSRRAFLRRSVGAGLATAALSAGVGAIGFRSLARAAAGGGRAAIGADPARPRLVCIFLRGGMDGLSAIVPHGEAAYYAARPDIAVARPGTGEGAAIDLDGRFGLNPGLAALLPAWKAGELAAVQAVGSPHPSRSHFDAQDFMETGTPGMGATPDGWLNRCLQQLAETRGGRDAPSAFSTVALADRMPRTLAGPAPVMALQSLQAAGVKLPPRARRRILGAFGDLYAGGMPGDPVMEAGRGALDALAELRRLNPAAYEPANGAVYPGGGAGGGPKGNKKKRGRKGRKGRVFAEIAMLLKDPRLGVDVVFAEAGGWDTHANQGAGGGQLTRKLTVLGDGLAALRLDLGPLMENTVILTMSEFGRTVEQNGTGGTDHGHGTVMLAMGGPVQGGRVLGSWPGLTPEARYEGRDLAVTTDFRDLLSEIAAGHLGVRDLGRVFPGHTPGLRPGVLRT